MVSIPNDVDKPLRARASVKKEAKKEEEADIEQEVKGELEVDHGSYRDVFESIEAQTILIE